MPRSVLLCDGRGAAGTHVGTGVWLGEHHGGCPASVQTARGPMSLLIVAFDCQRVSYGGSGGVEERRRRVGAHQHFIDGPHESGRGGYAANTFGDADAPPLGVFDDLNGLGQFCRHRDSVIVRIEDGGVAITVNE